MDGKKSPFTSLLPKLPSFIMGLVWIHTSNSSMRFDVLPLLEGKGRGDCVTLVEKSVRSQKFVGAGVPPPQPSWPCCFSE